jgi:AcrR family transcriptional regulator
VSTVTPQSSSSQALECQVIDAVLACVAKWGWEKVTMDDVCSSSGVSRATVYRLFPGGRDVLFEAVRERELQRFFTVMRAHIEGADTFEELLVRCVVVASSELRHDAQLAAMLATAPGEMIGNLTVDGVGRIVQVATEFITPLTDQYISTDDGVVLIEVVVRLVISFFLSPSLHVDFTNEESARNLVRTFIHPGLGTYATTIKQPTL